jgi:hypothetical protein
VDVNQYVFVRGVRETRGALTRWNNDPWPVLRSWVTGGLAVAVGLLATVWAVSSLATPDLTPLSIPGVTESRRAGDVADVLLRNSLVLALHAVACVAGFIAGSWQCPC